MDNADVPTNETGNEDETMNLYEHEVDPLMSFAYNCGVLLCFLVVLLAFYLFFLYLTTVWERRFTRRWNEARADFLKKNLVVREWKGDGSDTDASSATDHHEVEDVNANGIHDVQNQLSVIQTEEDDDGDDCLEEEHRKDECPICLAPFENHDRVCESNNSDCRHVFHEECLTPWLVNHNRCPVCRNNYLIEAV